MVVPFREAYRIRQEEQNRMAWLQGMYIYEALCDVSPILHAFAKSGTRARPYPAEPYKFETNQKKKTKAEIEEEQQQNAVNYMNNLMARFNQSYDARHAASALTGNNDK